MIATEKCEDSKIDEHLNNTCAEVEDECSANKVTVKKLSHKKWRRLWKKEKRKKMRQQKQKILARLEEEERLKIGLITEEAIEAKRKQDEWQEMLQEKKRQKLHEQWLTVEREAQEEFQRQQAEEERKRQERLDQERRIKEEWEAQLKQEELEKERKEKAIKDREENLNLVLEKSGILKTPSQDGEEWHNPIVQSSTENSDLYGTERDPNNCSFYLKTGACRFGERCSRQHPRPSVSQTLLIPNMFHDVRLTEIMLDEKDQDVGLELDEEELYHNFKEFYKDVLDEFKSVGQVYQFKVCSNFEPHLRGNVYVQYRSEEEALNAYGKFNGRWYAGKQLSVQFSPVTKWKSAICGTFARNKCPRGKNCNFLHVFHNPSNEFRDADRDFDSRRSPTQSSRYSEREWRSSTRDLERRWDRAESVSSEKSRGRDYGDSRYKSNRLRGRTHGRSRERSRSNSRYSMSKVKSGRSSRRRRSRSRSRRRSRSRGRSRSRSHGKSRSRSRSPRRRRKIKVSRTGRDRNQSSDSESSDNGVSLKVQQKRAKRQETRPPKLEKEQTQNEIHDEFVPEFDSDY